MISKVVDNFGILNTLLNSIENGDKISVFGCGKGEKLTILNESGKFVLFVCEDEKTAYEFTELFENINLKSEVLTQKDSFSEIFVDNVKTINVLQKLIKNEIDVLLITPAILTKLLPNKNYLINSGLQLMTSQTIDVDDVKKSLTNLGFERVDYLEMPKQFLVRGDVIEVFYDKESYYRLMFSFGELEKIKLCNPTTLLPIKDLEFVEFNNLKYLNVNKEQLDEYLSKNNNEYAKNLYEIQKDCNSLMFLPFADNLNANIFDYLPADSVIAINDVKLVYNNFIEFVKEFNNEVKELIKLKKLSKDFEKYCVSSEINFPKNSSLLAFQYITNANKFFKPDKVFNIASSPSVSYYNNLNLLVQDVTALQKHESTILLFVKSSEGAQKIISLFDKNRVAYNVANTNLQIIKNAINIIPKKFGVSARFNEEGLFIIGSDDLFAPIKKLKNVSNDSFSEAFLPETNDFVVHNIHGIGKYLGVKCLELKGGKRDFFVVEYKNKDVLYLPVENLSSLSKYVGADKSPHLNKLGGGEFVKTKERVKQKVKESAINLINLYSQRQIQKGYVYPKDDEMMTKFESSFGYIETADQAAAINDIKTDMESGKLMDRLVCGDVGFGKTEVALRAAFKTIMAGKQVAFLCPTTILSQQHYNTALLRFKNFGINVEVLNRFKSEKECQIIYDKINSGNIDLIVGTHKLLNKNIAFKNLGLLILDEEQKFGVEDKEHIKDVKNNVNVLTLSATPIPRTLHMSLTGIRDISVIDTPPVSRIPVQVSVVEYDDAIIKNSVSRELERGGQVLIIYNKVESIFSFASKIKSIVGENVKVGVAHGQMNEKELEGAIYKLYNGETDVLVSTTLIENGIDLPNANTLVVINSDMLGLSQLYQLKGRIGRGDRQAFAYFTYDEGRLLNENAYKRLEAISQFTSMGSGFKIALRDLEIRGGGNVLGVEQSGHMEKVGYALYLQILNEVITELKGEKVNKVSDVKIETALPAYISNEFENLYNTRISLYLKISKINSMENLKKVLSDLAEIYQNVPEEIVNLSKISLIRHFASNILAQKVVIKPNQAVIYFDDIESFNEKIVGAISIFSENAVSNMEKMPIINLNANGGNILDLLLNFLECCLN